MISSLANLQPYWFPWSIYTTPWVKGNNEITYSAKELQFQPNLYIKDYKTLKISDKGDKIQDETQSSAILGINFLEIIHSYAWNENTEKT